MYTCIHICVPSALQNPHLLSRSLCQMGLRLHVDSFQTCMHTVPDSCPCTEMVFVEYFVACAWHAAKHIYSFILVFLDLWQVRPTYDVIATYSLLVVFLNLWQYDVIATYSLLVVFLDLWQVRSTYDVIATLVWTDPPASPKGTHVTMHIIIS